MSVENVSFTESILIDAELNIARMRAAIREVDGDVDEIRAQAEALREQSKIASGKAFIAVRKRGVSVERMAKVCQVSTQVIYTRMRLFLRDFKTKTGQDYPLL